MVQTLKKWLLIGIAGAIFYALMSYHFIFFGKTPRILPKSEKTFEYTFFSVGEKKPIQILKIDQLREDGIGDLLVEEGMITMEEKYELEDKVLYGEY
jgi:hypothetical protein